jgi:hypothetical protein
MRFEDDSMTGWPNDTYIYRKPRKDEAIRVPANAAGT